MISFPVRSCRRAWLALPVIVTYCGAQPAAAPAVYLHDRGEGVTTSLFGTYVRGGEWLVYPFYEYARNDEEEYHGS